MSAPRTDELVGLTWAELHMCVSVGSLRRLTALRQVRARGSQSPDDAGFDRDIVGMVGEYALAKHLGVAFSPTTEHPDTGTGDVAGYQVKATVRRNGCLIVKPGQTGVFVLVTVNLAQPSAAIPGWTTGEFAEQAAFLREDIPQPAFMVPQRYLSPISDLPESVEEWYPRATKKGRPEGRPQSAPAAKQKAD